MSSRRTRLALPHGLVASAGAVLFARRRAPRPEAGEPWRERLAALAPAERRRLQLAGVQGGEPGTGGFYGTWETGSPDADVAGRIEFQYAGMEHQSETALSGMWLFLATEVLFFGGLFLLYMIYRSQYPQAFALASRHTEAVIGTVNVLLLLTSSAVFAWGLGHARLGDNRRLFWACAAVSTLGLAFLLLKGWEWHDDLDKHLFPGPEFAITGPLNGGAQLFWIFYWVATALHAVHMLVGIALVCWLGWTARRGPLQPALRDAGGGGRAVLELCRHGLAVPLPR